MGEGLGQLADLVAARDVDPVVEVAARDRDRAGVEPGDRPAQAPAEQRGEDQREAERERAAERQRPQRDPAGVGDLAAVDRDPEQADRLVLVVDQRGPGHGVVAAVDALVVLDPAPGGGPAADVGADRDRRRPGAEPVAERRQRVLALLGGEQDLGAERALDAVGEVGVERHADHDHALQRERLVDDRRDRADHEAAAADVVEGDPLGPALAGPDQRRVGPEAEVLEPRVLIGIQVDPADDVVEDGRAPGVLDLDERRRQVAVLAGDDLGDRELALGHRPGQVARHAEAGGVGAIALDRAQHQVEADLELALGLVVEPALEGADHDADRQRRDQRDRDQGGQRQGERQLLAQAEPRERCRDPAQPLHRFMRRARA